MKFNVEFPRQVMDFPIIYYDSLLDFSAFREVIIVIVILFSILEDNYAVFKQFKNTNIS